LPPVERDKRDEALQRNTDEIMYRIAALLPEGYRGVYRQSVTGSLPTDAVNRFGE
jgi:hypothetical protein